MKWRACSIFAVVVLIWAGPIWGEVFHPNSFHEPDRLTADLSQFSSNESLFGSAYWNELLLQSESFYQPRVGFAIWGHWEEREAVEAILNARMLAYLSWVPFSPNKATRTRLTLAIHYARLASVAPMEAMEMFRKWAKASAYGPMSKGSPARIAALEGLGLLKQSVHGEVTTMGIQMVDGLETLRAAIAERRRPKIVAAALSAYANIASERENQLTDDDIRALKSAQIRDPWWAETTGPYWDLLARYEELGEVLDTGGFLPKHLQDPEFLVREAYRSARYRLAFFRYVSWFTKEASQPPNWDEKILSLVKDSLRGPPPDSSEDLKRLFWNIETVWNLDLLESDDKVLRSVADWGFLKKFPEGLRALSRSSDRGKLREEILDFVRARMNEVAGSFLARIYYIEMMVGRPSGVAFDIGRLDSHAKNEEIPPELKPNVACLLGSPDVQACIGPAEVPYALIEFAGGAQDIGYDLDGFYRELLQNGSMLDLELNSRKELFLSRFWLYLLGAAANEDQIAATSRLRELLVEYIEKTSIKKSQAGIQMALDTLEKHFGLSDRVSWLFQLWRKWNDRRAREHLEGKIIAQPLTDINDQRALWEIVSDGSEQASKRFRALVEAGQITDSQLLQTGAIVGVGERSFDQPLRDACAKALGGWDDTHIASR